MRLGLDLFHGPPTTDDRPPAAGHRHSTIPARFAHIQHAPLVPVIGRSSVVRRPSSVVGSRWSVVRR
ncbi:MAG: hypothetical protein AVDCRST_MAG26-3280 [uncultured Chloroflexia bacterium]|uniref:Uncharacterized protein n=1 Tax=uncultured Chloroflexia bacterium TaxID=1672391 RepID=A0A6J4JJI8_9CHLR|nr:MAG: hypothetical protein AVDCRST_MAG26-3280 [uncultured Chloroflexia bacterium]